MLFVTRLLLTGSSSSSGDIRDESFIRSKFGENCGGWSIYEFFGDLSIQEQSAKTSTDSLFGLFLTEVPYSQCYFSMYYRQTIDISQMTL